MATSTLTALNLVNQALQNLGEHAITAFNEETRTASHANEIYTTVRDAVLYEHPWNFAMVRTTLYAYTEPDTTLTPGGGATVADTQFVGFTAGTAVFSGTDVGKTIRGDGVDGMATITSVSTTQVVLATINTAFSGDTLASGAWRLYSPTPTWGYTFRIAEPTDCLRIWRVDPDAGQTYQKEGVYFVTDAESLNVLYIQQVTDTTLYPPMFVEALVARLTYAMAEGITGQLDKAKAWLQIYDLKLKLAKAADGQEGTPARLEANELVWVRYGGWSQRPDRGGSWD